ncbi:hypothetical protein BGX29_000323 [Mortierella sp. GBA35]|nr:hypothetical protein BGX29_000323 [Mortierella sp. GBA35]KAG0199098.1 hypothetical protein BGX33_011881 [Mortierella sp. NVP41]
MPTADKPAVLIVGAGLGGLMLGALLEKSGFPYEIFERAAAVKALGSVMSVGPTILPIFEQLGILDDFVSIGKYGTYNTTYKESMEPNRPTDYLPIEGFTGYKQYPVARPKLYDLLLSQVPPHKVHFGAVTAIHDAVALANLLYALPTTTASEITKVFEEYKAERHPAAVDSYKNS